MEVGRAYWGAFKEQWPTGLQTTLYHDTKYPELMPVIFELTLLARPKSRQILMNGAHTWSGLWMRLCGGWNSCLCLGGPQLHYFLRYSCCGWCTDSIASQWTHSINFRYKIEALISTFVQLIQHQNSFIQICVILEMEVLSYLQLLRASCRFLWYIKPLTTSFFPFFHSVSYYSSHLVSNVNSY